MRRSLILVVSRLLEFSMDWSVWSKDSVALMQQRNEEWRQKFELEHATYFWDLETAEIGFTTTNRRVIADMCVAGTVSHSEGTFLWGWANESLPALSIAGLETVRAFGEEHDLELLTSSSLPGGRAQGLECVAIAGRLQNAAGVFIDPLDDVTMFFTLNNFRDASDIVRSAV
jgi:hypothetical protein